MHNRFAARNYNETVFFFKIFNFEHSEKMPWLANFTIWKKRFGKCHVAICFEPKIDRLGRKSALFRKLLRC